jgi:hypothetical protein
MTNLQLIAVVMEPIVIGAGLAAVGVICNLVGALSMPVE